MNALKLRSRKTTTRWNLFFGYFGIAYAVVLGVFFVPLYLRFIPVDHYGAWLASGNILFWLSAVDMGLTTVIIQRVGSSYGSLSLNEAGAYSCSGIVLCIALGTIALMIGGVLSLWLPDLLGLGPSLEDSNIQGAFFLAVIGTSLSLIGFGVSAANQGLQGSLGVGLGGLFSQIISLAVILFCVLAGLGLYALGLGIATRGAMLLTGNTAYLIWRTRKESIRLKFGMHHLTDLTKMLGFSSIGKIGYTLAEQTDAFLVTRFLGPESTLALVLTKRGPSIGSIVLLRPGNAFAPSIAHLVGEGKWEQARVLLCRLLRILLWMSGCALAGFISLNSQFMELWVGSRFYAGAEVNVVIVLALLFGVPIRNMALLCNAMGDIQGIALVAIARGLATFMYMLIGIHFFGILGAALGPLLGLLTVSVFYVPRSFAKLLRLDRNDINLLLWQFVLAALTGFVVSFYLPYFGHVSWVSLLLNSALVSMAYLIMLAALSKSFRAELQRLARSRIVGTR